MAGGTRRMQRAFQDATHNGAGLLSWNNSVESGRAAGSFGEALRRSLVTYSISNTLPPHSLLFAKIRGGAHSFPTEWFRLSQPLEGTSGHPRISSSWCP